MLFRLFLFWSSLARSDLSNTWDIANIVQILAFILYRQHYQAMVVAHNPGLANPEISKIIGEQWRSLSEDDKSNWKALAEVR